MSDIDQTPTTIEKKQPRRNAKRDIDEALAKIDEKQVRLNAKRQSLVKKRDKAKAALKFKLGGLAMMVGAHEIGEATLVGALHNVVKIMNDPVKGPSQLKIWNQVGTIILEDAERRRQEKRDEARRDNPPIFISVSFPTAPPDALRSKLKGHGLSWKEERKRWEGNVPKKSVVRLFEKVRAHQGDLGVPPKYKDELLALVRQEQ